MSYKKITDKSSNQYKIIHSKITVCKDGLLRNGKYVGVALGSRYGDIGDKFEIKLSSGYMLYVIKIDEKSDNHTTNGCHDIRDCNIEFVIDIDKAYKSYKRSIILGDFNNEFKGYIEYIREV